MDVSKVRGLIAEAQKELNGITDAEFQARRLSALRPLTLAAQALALADGHLEKAAAKTAPKAEAPAAEKKAAGKK